MTKDLRTFLEEWEEKSPGDILRIDKEISANYEVTALQWKLGALGKYPIIICEKPIKVDGTPSEYPLVVNLTANRHICAEVIGIRPDRVAAEYNRRMAEARVAPVVISKDQAPVKEVTKSGEKVNLWEFPVVTHHVLDPGPYITAGFVTTYDPDTGISNTALQRCQVKTRNKTGFYADSHSHNARNVRKFWEANQDVPVAVWIGHHPAALIGGQQRLGHPESHYPSMGGLLGEPLRIVPTETFGDELMVPADAELVIEGYIPKHTYEAEGPFGEYTGYVGPQRPSFVINVTCVTHRTNAYYQDIAVGQPDTLIVSNFPMEARVYEVVRQVCPDVTNVHIPLSAHRFHCYVQVKKTRAGVGKEVILAALPCDIRIKHVIVVDEDIDIFDDKQVLWAIGSRTQWNRDVYILPDLPMSALDPSLSAPGTYGCRGGIDATKPLPLGPGLPNHFAQVNRVPPQVMERIRVEDFVEESKLRSFRGTF